MGIRGWGHFPRGSAVTVTNPPAMQEPQETQVWPLGSKIPWRSALQPTPVFLSGEPHGQRSLVGYSPQSHKKVDTTEVTEHARTHGNVGNGFLLQTEKQRGNVRRMCGRGQTQEWSPAHLSPCPHYNKMISEVTDKRDLKCFFIFVTYSCHLRHSYISL